MRLTRTHPYQRPKFVRESVQSALISLGLSYRIVYRNRNRSKTRLPRHGIAPSFWSYPPTMLWEILETAYHNYRRLIRRYHPDRGGSSSIAVRVIAAWNLVKRLFARRGFELA